MLGALFVWLGAQINIPLPFTPVPQSGQTLAILLVATLLPKPYGAVSVLLYLLAGLAGLPVFSDGGAGWKHLVGATGGYLLGFLFAGLYFNWTRSKSVLRLFFDFLLSHAVILLLGGLWLSGFVNDAWESGVEPFIVGAVLKSLIALAAVYVVRKVRAMSQVI